MEHDNIKGFDESDFGEKVKQKFYDEEVIKKDTEWMNSERKTYGFNAKEKDTANRKRDNKYKRKIEKDTEQVSNYRTPFVQSSFVQSPPLSILPHEIGKM